MTKRKAFGIAKDLSEGMSQAMDAVKNNAGQLRYEIIPLSRIQFDENNPRELSIQLEELGSVSLTKSDPLYDKKQKEYESLKSLAASIQKSGVRHAIEVYKDGKDYRLISGERRVLASMLAGKEDIQARVVDIKPSEYDIRYLQWIENIEREDLSLWERMRNVGQLVNAYTKKQHTPVTATVLKEMLGCTLPHAMTYLSVLNAPADIQTLIQEQLLTNLEKAALLSKIEDQEIRTKLAKVYIERGISVSELKKRMWEAAKLKQNAKSLSQPKKQGRQARKVTLGQTTHLRVAKRMIELILSQSSYVTYREQFADTRWEDFSSVSQSFQKLIKLMEVEEV